MRTQDLLAFLARPGAGKRMWPHLAGALVGPAILAWIALHTGPAEEEVVVHVTEPDVEVSIGCRKFRIEDRRYDPIVCRLTPGWHDLTMKRHGRILYQELFEVRRVQSLVLTAWDPDRGRPEPHIPRPAVGPGMPREGYSGREQIVVDSGLCVPA